MSRVARSVAAAIGLVVSSILAFVWALNRGSLAFFPLPTPTGAHDVGTSVFRTANGTNIQVWYPAAAGASGERAPYLYGGMKHSLKQWLESRFVATSAQIDVPVAAGKFPLLVYTPSWGGVRSDNTALAQNLASHGYVVVAMDDLYPSRPLDMSSARNFTETLSWATQKARLQSAAALAVVQSLEYPPEPGPARRFAPHIDRERVGMFGFSFGGAVAAEAATRDPRVRAAANLDGWIFGDAAERGVPRPFLIMSTDDDAPSEPVPSAEAHFSAILDRENTKQILDGFHRYGGYLLTIRGTGHYNFADAGLFPTFRHTGTGRIDKRLASALVGTYLVAFFDHFLCGDATPLLDAASSGGAGQSLGHSIDPAARLEIWDSARVTSFDARSTRTARLENWSVPSSRGES